MGIFKKGLVSVIVPTYNRAHLIGDTVKSVLNQTYQNFEILVVDDGSSDNTQSVVGNLKDRRIRYFWQENTSMPARMRNKGISRAEGEYITFLDSDDIWLPQKLEKQVNFLDQNKDVFLLYSKCFIQQNGKIVCVRPLSPKKGHIFEDLFLSYNFIPCLTVMMRRGPYFFDEREELKAAEDFDLWLRVSRKEKISFIDEPLAVYMRHSGNISDSDIETLKKWEFIIERYKRFMPKIKLFKKYVSFYKKAFRIKMAHYKKYSGKLSSSFGNGGYRERKSSDSMRRIRDEAPRRDRN